MQLLPCVHKRTGSVCEMAQWKTNSQEGYFNQIIRRDSVTSCIMFQSFIMVVSIRISSLSQTSLYIAYPCQ